MARACGSLRLSASPERGRYGRRAAPRAHGRRSRRRRLRRGRPRRVTIKKLSGARAAWLRRAGRVVERAGRVGWSSAPGARLDQQDSLPPVATPKVPQKFLKALTRLATAAGDLPPHSSGPLMS